MGNRQPTRHYNQESQSRDNLTYFFPAVTNNNNLDIDQTQTKTVPDDLEVETVMLDESGTESHLSAANGRYIRRYRSEQELLSDQLEQTQTKLRMAIEQGQKLRAKTNRYEDELGTLKAQQNQNDMTESQWKRKYNDMEKRYRDLKEDFDVLVARNKNGRDFLRRQKEEIQVLSTELQREKLDKDDLLTGSLWSLSRLSETGGTKTKKATKLVQLLQADNRLLKERVKDLTERNQRGREYLNKLELDKRQQENIIAELETDLHNVKTDRNELLTRLGMSSSLRLHENQDYIDFSEENKPSQMVDRYQQLYDNEWSAAFSELTVAHGTEEEQAIQILLDILTISFQHCQNLASSQLEDVEKTLREFNATPESLEGKEFITYLKAQRKMKYAHNIESIRGALNSQLHTLLPAVEPKSATKSYMNAVVDLCWLLNVQDPPCAISWDLRKGEPFQTDKYRVYMHSGKQVDYIVWPVLYLRKGGVVLYKGVAQAMFDIYEENGDEPIIVTTVMPPSETDSQSTRSSSSSNPGKTNFHQETANKTTKHEAHIEIDDSHTRKNIVLATRKADTTFPNPLRIEEVEIKVPANKYQSAKYTHKEEVDHAYEPVEVGQNSEKEKETEDKSVTENGSPFDQLYSVVNKPKRNPQAENIPGKSLTDVEYEEMEYVAEEECITRF